MPEGDIALAAVGLQEWKDFRLFVFVVVPLQCEHLHRRRAVRPVDLCLHISIGGCTAQGLNTVESMHFPLFNRGNWNR